MVKFKIGDVSKILQISPELIRYYEKIGIISPKRDPENGYRYYTLGDVNRLFDGRWLHAYGFPLDQLSKSLYESERADFESDLADRETDIENNIRYYTDLLESIRSFREKVSSLSGEISFEECIGPEIFFIPYKINDEYIIAKDDIAELKRWAAMIPFVNLTFQLVAPVDDNRGLALKEQIGFSIDKSYADRIGFKCDHTKLQHLIARKAVHTVFALNEEDDFLEAVNRIVDMAEEKGYKRTFDPYGARIAQFRENGVFKRYFEIWIPV